MPQQLQRKPTPASSQEITSAIVSAWKQVVGDKPKLSQVAKAWAQIAAETNRGRAIFNNNVGNIMWTKGNSHDYFTNTDTRSVNGNPAEREGYSAFFRSYPSLVDGVADYLTFIKNRPSAFKELVSGSPQEFSAALASVHYYDPFTKDDYTNKNGKKVPGYTSALTSQYNQFIADYRKGKISGNTQQKPEQEPQKGGIIESFIAKLNDFVSNIVGASNNTHLLMIKSNDDISSKIEFARIIKSVLQEELGIKSNIYTNKDNVDLEVISSFDDEQSENAIKEIAKATSNVFRDATKKFISVNMDTSLVMNAKSILPELDAKTAEREYRMFNLKIIKGNNGQG
jgi:hypothetical protein